MFSTADIESSLNTYRTQLHQLCPDLTATELDRFCQGLRLQNLAPKQPLLSVGDVPQTVGYILSGLLKGVYTDANGNRVNVNFFREGNGVGDYQAFRQRTASRYDFIAIEPCQLVLIPYAHFEQCCREIPPLERYYRIVLERALFTYIRRTERFLITDATARYQDFVQAEPDLFKRLSVSDLCSYLGIQRQTLTRIRKQLLGNK